MKKNKRVSLVNAREISSFFNMAYESPAVATISRLLDENGVERAVFPDTEDRSDILNYERKIEDFLKENPAGIIAFSCWTSGYGMATDMATIARKLYPEAIIAAGGPHFSSIEEITQSLKSGEFDIVFSGGCSPFIEFCSEWKNDLASFKKSDKGLEPLGNVPKEGLCYIDMNGEVVIGKRGRLKSPISPVLEVNSEYADIRVIVRDVCPNGCDYCVIEPSCQTEESLDGLLSFCSSFCQFIKDEVKKPVRFAIADSAPFADRKRLWLLLDKFRCVSGDSSFSLFADPQDIDEDMYHVIDTYNVTSLFFGRDRVTEDDILGRRFLGKIRPQSMLDEEKFKIMRLVDFLSQQKDGRKCEIYLGYILSPFESASSSKTMTEEIKFFVKYGIEKGVSIQTNLFVLDPYPGTAVAERLKGCYTPMRYFRHPYPNVWNGKSEIHLQMEITRLILSKLLCNPAGWELFVPFIDFAHKIQHESINICELTSSINDKHLKSLAIYVMEKIVSMNFHYLPTDPKYSKNIIDMHLLGCMTLVMINKRDWLQKGIFKEVIEAVKLNDGILPLLIKDLKIVKG